MSTPIGLLAGLAVAPATPQNLGPGDESPGVPFDIMLGSVIAMATMPPSVAAEAPSIEVLFDGEWEPEPVEEPDAVAAAPMPGGEPMILEKNLDNWLTAFSRRERATRPADGDRDPNEVQIGDLGAAEDPAIVAELAPPDRLTTVVSSIGLSGLWPSETISTPAFEVRLNPGAPPTNASTPAERKPVRELPQPVVVPSLSPIRSAVARPVDGPVVEIGGFGFPELPDGPSVPTGRQPGLQPALRPDTRPPLATTPVPAAAAPSGAKGPPLTPPGVMMVAPEFAPSDEDARATGGRRPTGPLPIERPSAALEELPPDIWAPAGLAKDVRLVADPEPAPASGQPGGVAPMNGRQSGPESQDSQRPSRQPPSDRRYPESVPLAATAETDPVRIKPVTTERVRAESVRTESVRTEPVRTEPARTELVRTEPLRTEAVGAKAAQPDAAAGDSIRPTLRSDVPTDLGPSLPSPTVPVPREPSRAPEPRTISGPIPVDRFVRRVDHLTLDLRDEVGDYGRIRVSVSGPLVRATIMPNDPAMADRLSLDIRQLKTSLEARGFPEPKLTVQAPAAADPVPWTPVHRDPPVDQPQAGQPNPQRRGEDDRRDRWTANRDQRRDDQRHQDPTRNSRQNRKGDT